MASIIGMVICLWTRTLLNVWIYFISIASVLGSFTDPLQCNLVAKIAAHWFPLTEQVIATTIGDLASLFGAIIGSFYILVFIDTNIKDKPQARSMMFDAMLYIAITYTLAYGVCLTFFRNKPASPPS
jgi:hypothetical protein